MTTDSFSDSRKKRHIYMDKKLDDLPLTMEAYRVYCHLCRRAGCDNNAFPSYKSIGEACFRGSFPNSPPDSLRRKAITAVKELISWNLVSKTSREIDGFQTSNHYSLTDMEDWFTTPTSPSTLIRGSKPSSSAGGTLPSAGGTLPSAGGTLPLVLGGHYPSAGGTLPLVLGGHYPSAGGTPKDYPIEDYPIEDYPLKNAPPKPGAPPTQENECEKSEQPNQEEPTPGSLASLLKKSESSHQHDRPSCKPTMPAGSFEKNEQPNIPPRQDPFLNNRTFNPIKGTHKSNASDPWMKTANMPNEEFAQWLFEKRYKNQPGKMLSDAKAEIRNSFERANDLWSEFLAQHQPTPSPTSSDSELSPIGYYSNRSLNWHKATFSELLDLGDGVGKEEAIAKFSNRYDQQDPGATDKWLDWMKVTHPNIYAHLHQQAA